VGAESKDPGGPIQRPTSMNHRGPSTALRPPFRLRFAQDDTRWSSGTPSEKLGVPFVDRPCLPKRGAEVAEP